MRMVMGSLRACTLLYLLTFACLQITAVLQMDFSRYWHDLGVIALAFGMTVLAALRLLLIKRT